MHVFIQFFDLRFFMSDSYHALADYLNSMPNGFPRTETGIELELLKKIFTPEDAELFCKLTLEKETIDQITARTGMNKEYLSNHLESMWNRGLIECHTTGNTRTYNAVPWILGIYELQQKFIDEEFARLHAKYIKTVGPYFLTPKPQIMQVIPIEQHVQSHSSPMPYEQLSAIINNSRSFAVNECICKKQTALLNRGCNKPREVCLSISESPNYFDNHPHAGRIITKEEALSILKMAEDAALVHMTANIQEGHYFICNCCGCCCVQLIAARFGMPETVNAHFFAVINPELCTQCGTCETRCQVQAIQNTDGLRSIIQQKCIGCGLCVSTCPNNAITLIHKDKSQDTVPPKDQDDWYREKSISRSSV